MVAFFIQKEDKGFVFWRLIFLLVNLLILHPNPSRRFFCCRDQFFDINCEIPEPSADHKTLRRWPYFGLGAETGAASAGGPVCGFLNV